MDARFFIVAVDFMKQIYKQKDMEMKTIIPLIATRTTVASDCQNPNGTRKGTNCGSIIHS